jgi:EpsI family protein
MGKSMKSARFWTVVVLLATTAMLLHARGDTDVIPASEPLRLLPRTIAGWSGSDLQIDPEQLSVLGPGDFLSRIYTPSQGTQPIGLFIAYFPTQRTGATIHSPKNCLPGAGWTFESSRYLYVKDANGKLHQVGEYVVAKGESRQFAIYWYQAQGRSVANEFMARSYLIANAVRQNRTDGALVRVTTPIDSRTGISAARVRAEAFSAQLFPKLSRFIPD